MRLREPWAPEADQGRKWLDVARRSGLIDASCSSPNAIGSAVYMLTGRGKKCSRLITTHESITHCRRPVSERSKWQAALAVSTLSLMFACIPSTRAPRNALEAETPIERILRQAQLQSWFVRASTDDGTYEGRVLTSGSGAIRIAGRSLSVSDIRRLERRSVRGSGAMVGAVVGAVALGVIGFRLTGLCDVSSGCGDEIALVGAGAVTGGFLGMVLGKAISPGAIEWLQIWRKEQ